MAAVDLYQSFLERYPAYSKTFVLDKLRETEFARLDRHRHVYVDYTGGGLYAESQVRAHADLLIDSVLGNPHSTNPSSALATRLVESCRARVLAFFNASPKEYTVIFTANATHALKLVGESYPFTWEGAFLLTFDNHNSVNGLREYSRSRGAKLRYVPLVPPDLRVPEDILMGSLREDGGAGPSLFAYPAQSNFSGVQHPLEWIERAHDHGWDVLLDAASFVPTNRLDLGRFHPDYLTLSFYKMFGYPTGIGALVARHEALAKLKRPWFSGGTITVASVQADQHFLADDAAAFEDGTVNYASLPAVEKGLDLIDEIGVDLIHERVMNLTGWLLERLSALRHGNGSRVLRIYGPIDTRQRGGTITVNVYDPSAAPLDHTEVERFAGEEGISLRTGCFCNPGAGEMALGIERDEIVGCFSAPQGRMSLDQFRQCIDGKSTGAVRVSLGMASNFADVLAVEKFFARFRQS